MTVELYGIIIIQSTTSQKSTPRLSSVAVDCTNRLFVCSQLSYAIGLLLFRDSVPMRLGFFFTGISPAGGASNIWTVLLGGNLNLSLTMTAISTIASFGECNVDFAIVLSVGNTLLDIPYSRIKLSEIT